MQARFRYLSFTAVLSSPNAFGIGLLSAGDSKVRCTWLSHYSAYIGLLFQRVRGAYAG